MTAMWVHTALFQAERFRAVMEEFDAGYNAAAFIGSFESNGRQPEWAEDAVEMAEDARGFTRDLMWRASAERYFLLLALAQVRKCARMLPDDDLPSVRDEEAVRLLRDIEEHWEQDEDRGRSLRRLRETRPDVSAGQILFGVGQALIGHWALDEVEEWLDEVNKRVRELSTRDGYAIPSPDEPVAIP